MFLRIIRPPSVAEFRIPATMWLKPNHGIGNMTSIRNLFAVAICMTSLGLLAFAQGAKTATPPRYTTAEAKNHIGELATVCGTAVDSKVGDPGLAGHGKPITIDLDEPQPKPVFYFVTFGAKPGGFKEAQETIAAFQGKQVCVTGNIEAGVGSVPFIFALDRTKIKAQAASK